MKYLKAVMAVLLIVTVFGSGIAFATDSNQQKLNEVNEKIADAKNQIKENKQKEKDLTTQIGQLDVQIEEKQKGIETLEVQIKETEAQIEQKKVELEQKQQEIIVQNDNLNARLRAMYKNGEVGYLEVLLDSGSFSELMNNIDMISRIYQMDEDFLQLLEDQYDQIAAVKAELEALESSLSQQQQQLEAQKAALNKDRAEAAELRVEVQGDIEELNKMLDELNATAQQITSLIRASQSTNTEFVGGAFINPAPNYVRVSSEYGYRIHPITKTKKLHTGIDLASAQGTKCVAAASGTVIYAGWYGGYGNAVVIDHGGGITTLYAHNSALLVSKGQQVTQGQQIAKIGSTGNSTGPHCHFEVRVNGSHTNPRAYLGV